MLLFERQCMGFFDDNGEDQEDLTSSVLSKRIQGNELATEMDSRLDQIRYDVNFQVDTEFFQENRSSGHETPQFNQSLASSIHENISKNQEVNEKINQIYRYFILDICKLVSIRECIGQLELTTRKEHYSLQQKINKLNNDAQKLQSISPTLVDPTQQAVKKQAGPVKLIKNFVGKLYGSTMTEKEIYLEIKAQEKKLKVVDQLQTYQTVFIAQVVIPNFNRKRKKLSEDFVKGTICKDYLLMIEKDIKLYDSLHQEI